MILHCSSLRPEAPEGGTGRIRIDAPSSVRYQYFYVASLLSISLCAFCKHSLNWFGTACEQFLIGFVIARAWGEIGQPKPGATGGVLHVTPRNLVFCGFSLAQMSTSMCRRGKHVLSKLMRKVSWAFHPNQQHSSASEA